MTVKIKQVMFAVAVLGLVLLPGCATISGSQVDAEEAIRPNPTRTFFGLMEYSMENQKVARGMRDLEELLYERFPDEARDESGEVPETYLGGMYRDASGGDRHITAADYESYRERFLREIEYTLPDPLRVMRRTR